MNDCFRFFAFAMFFEFMLEMNINLQLHFFQIPDEKSRFDDLHVYSSQDIIITLPTPMTVYDISFLSVSKEEVSNKNELESQKILNSLHRLINIFIIFIIN